MFLYSDLEILAFIPLSQKRSSKIRKKMSRLILPKLNLRQGFHYIVLVFSSLDSCHPDCCDGEKRIILDIQMCKSQTTVKNLRWSKWNKFRLRQHRIYQTTTTKIVVAQIYIYKHHILEAGLALQYFVFSTKIQLLESDNYKAVITVK